MNAKVKGGVPPCRGAAGLPELGQGGRRPTEDAPRLGAGSFTSCVVLH